MVELLEYVKAYDLLDNESEASLVVNITTHDVVLLRLMDINAK